MSTKTIRIDTDTLNDGFNMGALRAALEAAFPGADVEIKSTGHGTQVDGFDDNDDARDALRVIIERVDF
jgi:hypothetical protein